MSELLPCPFCGSAVGEASNVGEDEDNWFVGCMEGDCGVNPCVFHPNSEAEAIAAWNRRAPSEPATAALDFMALATFLAKVNAGRHVIIREGDGTPFVSRDVAVEAMQAILANTTTQPTESQFQQGDGE